MVSACADAGEAALQNQREGLRCGAASIVTKLPIVEKNRNPRVRDRPGTAAIRRTDLSPATRFPPSSRNRLQTRVSGARPIGR